MSTKIHHGYKVSVGSLRGLKEFNELAFKTMGLVAQAELEKIVSAQAVSRLDKILLGKEVKPEQFPCSPLNLAYGDFAERQLKARKERTRDPEIDLDVSWSLRPVDDQTVFALFSSEKKAFYAAWRSLPGVSHYPYWNNEDSPAGISEAEWSARGDEWDRVLKTPALLTELFDWYETPDAPSPEQVAAAQPSHRRRAAQFAEEILISRRLNPSPRPDAGLSDFMNDYCDAKEWVRESEEGRAAFAEMHARIGSILPTRWTAADLSAIHGAMPLHERICASAYRLIHT